jgi:hypothetical protein
MIPIPAVLLMAVGILLIAGLWTPIVGTGIALIEIWNMFALSGDKWVWLLLGTIGAALAMLGPGLWSIDARLFGWKRIEAPAPRKELSLSLRSPFTTKFLTSEEGNIRPPQESAICPHVGLCANEHRRTIVREFKPKRLNKECRHGKGN